VPAAARLALWAGIDVELPHTAGFGDQLLAGSTDLVDRAGLVNRAVLRVLAQKGGTGPARFRLAAAAVPGAADGRLAAQPRASPAAWPRNPSCC